MTKKVLYVINDLGVGGAQRIVADIVRYISHNKFTPIVYNLNYSSSKGVEYEIERYGIEVINFHSFFKGDFRCVFSIYKLIKKRKIDIVHSHLCLANFFATIAARMGGVNLIFSSEHNTTTFITRPWYYRLLARFYLRLNHRALAISKAVKNAIVLKSPALQTKTHVVYNGIDMSIFDAVRYKEDKKIDLQHTTKFRVGTLVRNDPRKGLRIFERSAEIIHKKFKNIEFVIAVRDNKDLETNILDKIRIGRGPCEVARYLSTLDLFVLPSFEEGLGLAAIEAMAMGRPVIASSVGGLLEVINHEIDGLLVSPGDVNALTEAIFRLYSDPNLCSVFGKAGIEKVRTYFNVNRMVTEIQNEYLKGINRLEY